MKHVRERINVPPLRAYLRSNGYGDVIVQDGLESSRKAVDDTRLLANKRQRGISEQTHIGHQSNKEIST